MTVVQVGEQRFHYQVAGEGPDVLLIHGWASSLRLWHRSSARLVEAGFRVWAVDLPGCGGSGPLCQPQGTTTISQFADLVQGFAEQVGIERAALVGHSMGGGIVLQLALTPQFSSAAWALVLVAPIVSGRLGLPARLFVSSPLGRRLLRLWQGPDAVDRLQRRLRTAAFWLARRPALSRDLADLTRTTPQAAYDSMGAVLRFDVTPHLHRIAAPTLVVVGTGDLTLPPAEAELAARQIPGARLVKMRARHQPMDEQPQAFDRVLVRFLQEASRASMVPRT